MDRVDDEFSASAPARLPAQTLSALTRLDPLRSSWALAQTGAGIALVIFATVSYWTVWVILPAVLIIGALQHALFILAHDAAHYRLFVSRGLNDAVGCLIGMASGISMRTYRVVHRLHHNHLYGPLDPDVPLHGGYPRGRRYLLRKLACDLCGLTAWKNYAYFFGHPAIATRPGTAARVLDDTSPALRAQARRDRWAVAAFQLALLALAATAGVLPEYLVLWVLPAMTVLQALLRLRALCEHGAVSDPSAPLRSARTVLAAWPIRWLLFPHHVNYHLAHHLYPAVPHYRLPALHAELSARGWLAEAEVHGLGATLRRIYADPGAAAP